MKLTRVNVNLMPIGGVLCPYVCLGNMGTFCRFSNCCGLPVVRGVRHNPIGLPGGWAYVGIFRQDGVQQYQPGWPAGVPCALHPLIMTGKSPGIGLSAPSKALYCTPSWRSLLVNADLRNTLIISSILPILLRAICIAWITA